MSVENEWGRAGWRGVVWRDSGFSAETHVESVGSGSWISSYRVHVEFSCHVCWKSPRAFGLGSTVKADGGRTVKKGNAGARLLARQRKLPI